MAVTEPTPLHAGDAQAAGHGGDEEERSLVVGVGAAAGGLEAFERFLQRVPSDSGLALVLVQHGSCERERLVPETLARVTHLPVGIAEEGQHLERDHVYVVPPDAGLIVEGGALRRAAAEPRDGRPVNAFLTSLAQDQRENAVAVVLSGPGSDGALGIAAVKKRGGSTFAQVPREARYQGMPAAAIATGMVEQVLPAAEIPEALVQLAAERRHHPPESASREAEGVRHALEAVARTTGLDFTRYKRSTILRRLQRRMAARGIADVSRYAAVLERDGDETRRLAEDLTVHVTSFFRDEEPFRTLERLVIPEVLERRRADGIRIWVPGCSSGEEVYSLAMLVRERLADDPYPPAVRIFATDIDTSALAEARRGEYGRVVEQQVSPERLARFFTRRGDVYAVTKDLRDLCVFAQHDLVTAPPFSRVDLASCRNLLVYLEPALRRRVVALLHHALRPDGWLLLGRAETIDPLDQDLFDVVDKTDRVFRRREVGRRPACSIQGRRVAPLEVSPPSRRGDPAVRSAADRSRGIVIDEYAPASVVVDARGEVRYYWGANLARYLPPQAGAPVTSLVHLVRSELKVELSAALHQAARQGEAVTYKDVVVEAEGVQHRLNIVARPLPPTEQDPEELYLVVFQELQAAPAAHGTPLDAPTLERYRQLERELASTHERLQATIDELEDANEALRASNEQLQATNEELNSANEELQTSEEDLQAVNGQIDTLNVELSRKVDELELLYGDLQNLFQSTHIATIFLDRESRIARFTPGATAVFPLAQGDVGRPLSDFAARLDVKDVPQEVARVLETLAPVERTVGLVDEKRSFLMRIHPYLTPNAIGGVVLSFVDVTRLKEAEAALLLEVAERERAEQALRDADRRKDEFLAILSHELRNPLAPIRSSLHVLEHAQVGRDAAARAQQIIGRQVGHLARLVDDLLDVTRIARGKLLAERAPLDLREVSQRAAEDHRSLFAALGVALEIALPDGELWIQGDATRLAQVIGNLLHNARKFTSRGDRVRLSLEAVEGLAVLRVRDTGVGIDPAMLPRLFQPFTQADTTLNRRLGGLGLGLALVKGLVELHGGSVEVASGGKGTGSEFVVRLPLTAAPARMAIAPAAPAPRPRRVLVIDDNLDAAESLQLALEMEGHEVAVAHDGPSGLERARELRPDVVLCDIGLPGMDGYAVAAAFRHEPALRYTFVVALTGHALPDDQRRASEAGFDAHLSKPATIDRIHEVIGRAPAGPPPCAVAPRSPPTAVS